VDVQAEDEYGSTRKEVSPALIASQVFLSVIPKDRWTSSE
jgi:hypothetical protein